MIKEIALPEKKKRPASWRLAYKNATQPASLSASFSWRYSPAGRPGGSISKANSQAAGGASRRNEQTASRINPSIPSLSSCRPAAALERVADDKAPPIEPSPADPLLVSSHLSRWKHHHGSAEERARAQVRQLGQRRQRAVHALLRQRAQGQGRRRQDDQPQRPRREPGGLLHGGAVADPLLGAGGADASAARAPAQRRAAVGAAVAQPLRRVAVPPPRKRRRRAGRRRRRVQRRAVATAPVQHRERWVRPRRQLRRPVPRQGRPARQRDADEGLGGAQVRRLGLEPGVGGRLHAHLQQGEGGEADPGGEAGGVRQGRRPRQRRQAAPRRRLRLIEILVLWMVQIEIDCLMTGDDDGWIQMLGIVNREKEVVVNL